MGYGNLHYEVFVNPHGKDIASKASSMDVDEFAHSRDHCLEVQIRSYYHVEKLELFHNLTNQEEYVALEAGSASLIL
jgi:hypothetical protein